MQHFNKVTIGQLRSFALQLFSFCMALVISASSLFLCAFNSLSMARKASIWSSSADVPLDGVSHKLVHTTSSTVWQQAAAPSVDEAVVELAPWVALCVRRYPPTWRIHYDPHVNVAQRCPAPETEPNNYNPDVSLQST